MHANPRHLLALLGLAAIVGCGRPDYEQRIRALATPTGALKSAHPDLPRLIRAVEQQRGLPLQLAITDTASSDSSAPGVLAKLFKAALHVEMTPKVGELLNPEASSQRRADFLREHQELIHNVSMASDLPRWVFNIEYDKGFFASMSYLDDAALAVRLLLLRSQHLVIEEDRLGSLADVLRALRVCQALARERRVEARALAASLRNEALAVAASGFDDGRWRRHEADLLYGALRETLSDWPDDGRMLMGERATVIHAYEAIREGLLNRMVTLDEYKQLSKRHIEAMESAKPIQIDADEVSYLTAMQRFITASETPYSQRVTEIDAAMAEVLQAPPLFAETLFIKDIPAAIETAAIDRTLVEAWTLALAAAAELVPPPLAPSPCTGRPLEVEQDAQRVEVYDGNDMLVSLPLLLQ